MKNNEKLVSNCCGAEIQLARTNEGATLWQCQNCFIPCTSNKDDSGRFCVNENCDGKWIERITQGGHIHGVPKFNGRGIREEGNNCYDHCESDHCEFVRKEGYERGILENNANTIAEKVIEFHKSQAIAETLEKAFTILHRYAMITEDIKTLDLIENIQNEILFLQEPRSEIQAAEPKEENELQD